MNNMQTDLSLLTQEQRTAAVEAWEQKVKRRAISSVVYAEEIGLMVLMDADSFSTVVDAFPTWTADGGDEWANTWSLPMTQEHAILAARRLMHGLASEEVLRIWRACFERGRQAWEESVCDYIEERKAERMAEDLGWSL